MAAEQQPTDEATQVVKEMTRIVTVVMESMVKLSKNQEALGEKVDGLDLSSSIHFILQDISDRLAEVERVIHDDAWQRRSEGS